MLWRYESPNQDDRFKVGFVKLVIFLIFCTVYLAVSLVEYLRWLPSQTAYQTDAGCTTQGEVVNDRTSLLRPMLGCVLTPGSVVSKDYVERPKGRSDSYITVRLADGDLRREQVVPEDAAAWFHAYPGDHVMVQLFRGQIATIFFETRVMRTMNNPVEQASSNRHMIVIMLYVLLALGLFTIFFLWMWRVNDQDAAWTRS